MKRFANYLLVALVVCALSGAAMAKVKSMTITFGQSFAVAGTTVKAGTYKVSFDDKTNELTLVDKKKAVVAKATAHLEDRKDKDDHLETVMADKAGSQALVRLAFPGDRQSIVINDGSQTAEK